MLRRTFLKNFAGSFGAVAVGEMSNERMDSFAPGSKDRAAMEVACATVRATTLDCPIMIDGKEFRTTNVFKRTAPSDHSVHLATGYNADKALAEAAVKSSLQAHYSWSRTSFQDRCAVILKAAHLITAKYRAQVQANTMLGQSKNAWQAEIDCVAEAADFLRFNVKYAQQIYAEQPLTTSNASIWNMTEYRPLEGFVAAVSPFNFTAIGVNLALAPVLMGNTVIWKPSPNAILSSFHMYKIFEGFLKRPAFLPESLILFLVSQMLCQRTSLSSRCLAVSPSLGRQMSSTRLTKRLHRTLVSTGAILASVVKPVARTSTSCTRRAM
ncbi:delta-1-pyrroline-5-carboxylate dehydrogenase, putative [Bodo saltans]|uniref:Delta-1-pyrroline-5-carboxylate dehydrogenase, putative n=1 Tax=Bodo saltans TaxID=75058 RepID=A0A0S4JRC0_BODSA|nr:delta-1-pyrroline-5-carboxylate dehydrogenase, putative [Bodo saltans]|eukprot:CUG92734.1 delta-1-pyrroline-5-carboxylate dehydrogenase, putative [Bodo saltans]